MSAQILPFSSQNRSRSFTRKTSDADFMPTVVILPCVRYERWGDEDGQQDTSAAAQAAAPARH